MANREEVDQMLLEAVRLSDRFNGIYEATRIDVVLNRGARLRAERAEWESEHYRCWYSENYAPAEPVLCMVCGKMTRVCCCGTTYWQGWGRF